MVDPRGERDILIYSNDVGAGFSTRKRRHRTNQTLREFAAIELKDLMIEFENQIPLDESQEVGQSHIY